MSESSEGVGLQYASGSLLLECTTAATCDRLRRLLTKITVCTTARVNKFYPQTQSNQFKTWHTHPQREGLQQIPVGH